MSIELTRPEEWEDRPDELTGLFAAYREACPENDGGAEFLPAIWRKIESGQSFWFSFERSARGFAAIAVAMCLLLVALNFSSSQRSAVGPISYADALANERTAERTYYAEGIRTTVPDDNGESPTR
jgi:hypothetical protein